MRVDYVDHMGSDLTVVNAARVSFNKHHAELEDGDEKLIGYLARNGHWTPFGHPQITLRMDAPVPIRTQCYKHKIGFIENEVSRRYTDEDVEFYIPDVWRYKPTDGAKQGSSGSINETSPELAKYFTENLIGVYEHALDHFEEMVQLGVAVEQARFILPQGMMCKWYWTGSLASFARFYKQRIDPHAQKEIQDLAKMVGEIIQPLFPVSWSALTDK